MPEPRLDLLDQDAAEDVAPGVVGGDADARFRAPRAAKRRGGSSAGSVASEIDAGIARERVGDGQPLGLGERVDAAPAIDESASRPSPRAASARIAAQSSISTS